MLMDRGSEAGEKENSFRPRYSKEISWTMIRSTQNPLETLSKSTYWVYFYFIILIGREVVLGSWVMGHGQALTSTRGYSLPDFLKYYPYPTRNILLPDRVEGSEEHRLCPNIDKYKEWKCNTFVMVDISQTRIEFKFVFSSSLKTELYVFHPKLKISILFWISRHKRPSLQFLLF